MKAIILKENGGIEKFLLSEMPMPVIKPDEVLIQVQAISINPVDTFVRQNRMSLQNILKPEPGQDVFILGWDISGTVMETGSAVKEFHAGDAVFGMVNFPGQGKAYAEYVAAPANQLAPKPENISHEEAAAATLAALTAWQALVTHGKIKSGDNVIIHAAAGGVGHYAVQIAKHFGAQVTGTASAVKKQFVQEIGADTVIDYNSVKFEDEVKDADIVLDSIASGEHLLRSIQATRKGGKVISIKSHFDGMPAEMAKEKELFTIRMMVNSNGQDMKEVARLLANGKMKSHVSKKFSFTDLPKAHQEVETGRTQGKVIVLI
jgi:NADPH:quinone reductase-like Zn-dependent oxidoreductase